MYQTPVGAKQFVGAEANLIIYGAHKLGTHLAQRYEHWTNSKPWSGVIMQGNSAFAKSAIVQQLVTLASLIPEMLDTKYRSGDKMRNAACEAIFAWIFYESNDPFMQKLVFEAAKELELCDNEQDIKSEFGVSAGGWESLIDAIATFTCYDAKYADKNLRHVDIITTPQLLQSAIDYLKERPAFCK